MIVLKRGGTIGLISMIVRIYCIHYFIGIDFFHHNEDSTLYKRNLCFICQNPSIVIEKSRIFDSISDSIEKCESCGKLVCHNCSYICSRCSRFVCSFCENTMYDEESEWDVDIPPRERRLFVSIVVAAASSCLFLSPVLSTPCSLSQTRTH